MHEVQIKFIKAIVARLIISGLFLIVVGVLIFVYPALLGILVGVGLVISGILTLSLAHKVNHYSRIRINI